MAVLRLLMIASTKLAVIRFRFDMMDCSGFGRFGLSKYSFSRKASEPFK